MKGEPAPSHVLETVTGVFDGISGLGPVTAMVEDDAYLTVRFTGWGPTLHERRFTLGVDVSDVDLAETDGEADQDMVRHVTHSLMDQAHGQRTLAVFATQYGLESPMARPGDRDDPETSGHSVGHLLVDQSVLAALLGAKTPQEAAEHLVNAVSDTIGGDADEMDQDVHGGSDPAPLSISYPCATGDEERAHIAMSPEESAMTLGHCTMDLSRKLLDGDGVVTATVVARCIRFEPEVLAELSDTLAVALIGRPLGELAATGCDALDAMTITGFSTTGDGVDVGLVSVRIRLADHPDIGQHLTVPGDGR